MKIRFGRSLELRTDQCIGRILYGALGQISLDMEDFILKGYYPPCNTIQRLNYSKGSACRRMEKF